MMTMSDLFGPGLKLWNRLEPTDKDQTKRFDRGQFKGTSVDPIYNIKRVTEALGPVGFSWGWEVKSERLDTFGEGTSAQTVHSCIVRAWFRQPDGSKEHVEHCGLTKVAYHSRDGRLVVDDEYAKKSVTDALSKIMLSLGASADIWLGRFDGVKYTAPQPDKDDQSTPPKVEEPTLPVSLRRPYRVFDQGSRWSQAATAKEAVEKYRQLQKFPNDAREVAIANLELIRRLASEAKPGSEAHKRWNEELEATEALAEIRSAAVVDLPSAHVEPVPGARPVSERPA
jgi:hypothetical protein